MQEILKKRLSSSFATVVIFSVAVLAKIQLLRIFIHCGSDELTQALMAKNFLAGHGMNVSLSSLNDLSVISYVPFTGWPPGYSVLLMPFLSLFNNRLVLSSFCIDIIATLVFFYYLRKTLLLIRFPVWLTNLFVLFQGFFLPIYIVNSAPTDFLGAAILLATVYYSIKITSRQQYSARLTTGLVLFSICSVMLKYQNMAINMMLAALLIYTGILQRQKHWRKAGITTLAILLLTCCAVLLYQQWFKGSSFYIQPAKAGFFPENLVRTYPFAIGSLVNLEFYTMQLSMLFNTDYTTVWYKIELVSSLLAIVLCILFAGYLFKSRLRITDTFSGFMLFGGLTAAATVAILVTLSLTRSADIGPPLFNWTFVTTGRYFSFVILFTQVALWWWLLQTPLRKKPVKRILAAILVVTISIEILHGFYFAVKKSSKTLQPISEKLSAENWYDVFMAFKEQQQNLGRKVAVANFHNLSWALAGWYNCSAISTPAQLNSIRPKSSEPAALMLILEKNEIFLMRDYLEQPGVQLYLETDKFNFYTQYIEPSSNNTR